MFAAGHLADRTGPRLVLGGGLLVSGIGIGLMSVMAAPWHALALYGVVFALGNGAASMITVGVMVTRAFPKRTGIANAVVMSGMSVGQLVMIATLAAVMMAVSWRSVYLRLGVAHLALVPLLIGAIPKTTPTQAKAARPNDGVGVIEAARSRQFWLLLAIYAICGFDDFFVTTHVVAFAQDRGVDAFLAGNLLALMGLTGLIGVVAAGAFSDRSGPGVADRARLRRPRRGVRAGDGGPVGGLGGGVRAGVRRHLPRDRAAHRRVRVGEFRHPPSRRPHRPDHHGTSDFRRHRRLSRRRRVRRHRHLRHRLLDDARGLAARPAVDPVATATAPYSCRLDFHYRGFLFSNVSPRKPKSGERGASLLQ